MTNDTEQSNRLIRPPQLRTGEDRSASRLELFLDLAYVLVVAEIAGAFALDLTWHGAVVFAVMFAITWWSWVTITLYANRFDTDDVHDSRTPPGHRPAEALAPSQPQLALRPPVTHGPRRSFKCERPRRCARPAVAGRRERCQP